MQRRAEPPWCLRCRGGNPLTPQPGVGLWAPLGEGAVGGGFATSTELVKRPERSLASVVVPRGHLAPVLPQQAQKTGMLLAPGHPAKGPHSTAADTRLLWPLKAGSSPPSGVADIGPSEGQIMRPSDGPGPAEPRGPAVSLLLKTRKAQLRMRFENGDVGWALLGLVCDLFAGVVGGISAEGTPCVWSLPDTGSKFKVCSRMPWANQAGSPGGCKTRASWDQAH